MNWVKRFIKGVDARELSEREARNTLRKEFGVDDGFADSEPDSSNWALLEPEPGHSGWSDTLSPRSAMRLEMNPSCIELTESGERRVVKGGAQ